MTKQIPPPYILGISEKPQAAGRLAWAIDEKNNPERKRINNVPIYICNRDGNRIVIVPAIGHLFTLSQIGRSWNYPTLDFCWVPAYKESKSKYTKNFVKTFSDLKEDAKDVIVMTDYDREGEVIGYLILKYLLELDDAERMKFSTLTRRDINEAYRNREKHLNKGFLSAGLLRHYVDWLFGINFSRALTSAYNRISGFFKTLSIGRVQGPTLSFVVEKEREINSFVPLPYWKIESEIELNSIKFSPEYEKDRIDVLKNAEQIIKECSSLKGEITNIKKEKEDIYNYPPFNLSDLQRQAYWHFKFSPSRTLKIAEKLYLQGVISYPRTDSQKLPMTLGHKKILSKLEKIADYEEFAKEILDNKKFKPYEGKKKDAAHPAIHPTGNSLDSNIDSDEKKLYDLIVKRYLSLFGDIGKKLNKDIEISIHKHRFFIHGQEVIEEGWMKYYKPYISIPDIKLPEVKVNTSVSFSSINKKEYFTRHPKRYNESSLLQIMENNKIGTKATRADIISTLYSRGYIEGRVIRPTSFGIAVESVLNEFYPLLITPTMTRRLEDSMDSIETENKDIDTELLRIKSELNESLQEFYEKEEEIGLSLTLNLLKTKEDNSIILGRCVECDSGNLRIIKSKKTGKKFIACSAYTDSAIRCEASYPLPSYGNLKPTEKTCPYDHLPLVRIQKGKETVLTCISPECPSLQKE